MSYNNRRGNIAFNKNISSSSVGQRRPIVTNNYVQQQNQSTPRGQQTLHPSAQQQLAKQQQMLVQKKQQLAQHQRQQQQKQQIVQQKQQLVNKQQLEHLSQQKKEIEMKKQRDMEIQKQKELEQQKKKELEQQKQKELQQQKQKELELQKEKELEQQKQIKLELEEKQIKIEQPKEQEDQNQQELEQKKQVELEQKPNEDEIKQSHQFSTEVDISQDEKQEIMFMEDQELTTFVLNENEVYKNVDGNKSERKKWSARRKLSKYEIQRRRNFRLGKLLQPKNAMIVLNEVVKNVTFTVDDCQNIENSLYRATALVDGIEHEGFATSKVAAKNIAAEKALKYLVKHKKLMQTPNSTCNALNQAETESMDTTEKEEKDIPLAWQQFASFAVYKLLASWGEDPNSIREEAKVNKKPSKKIPENAHLMHPLMLLNQMMPLVRFEELSRSADGHTVTYSFKCTVDGQTFVGSGTSKKTAKKQAAFEVCRTILGIDYPPEIYIAPVPISV